MEPSDDLVNAVMASAEVMGTELSRGAARMLCADLGEYPQPAVLAALTKCRREVRNKLTLADVIARIDDGRPGPQEAWAMMPRAEAQSVVWTDEMAAAMTSAQPLLDAGDDVAARMAFLEHYAREVTTARHQARPVRWTPSLGHDPYGRESALRDAVEKNRITVERARLFLPHGNFEESKPRAALSGPTTIKELTHELPHLRPSR